MSFSPAISQTVARSLRQVIRRQWNLKAWTHVSLNELARRLNPIIAGWINYYGRFCRSALHAVLNHINLTLVGWAMRKFKRLQRRRSRAHAWLKAVARRERSLFVH